MNEFQVRDAMLRGAERAIRQTREELFGDQGAPEDADAACALGRRFHLLLADRLVGVERNINHYAMVMASNTQAVLVSGTVAT